VEKLNKVGPAERKLVTELGREPTPVPNASTGTVEADRATRRSRSAAEVGPLRRSFTTWTGAYAASRGFCASANMLVGSRRHAGGLRPGVGFP
jgi:hypothetical protein